MKIISKIPEDLNYELKPLCFHSESFSIDLRESNNTIIRTTNSGRNVLNLKLENLEDRSDTNIQTYVNPLVLIIQFPDNYSHILHDVIPVLLHYENNSEYDVILTAGSDLMSKILKTLSIFFKKIHFIDFGIFFKAKTIKVENYIAPRFARNTKNIKVFKNLIEDYFHKNENFDKVLKTVIYYSRSGDPSIENARHMEAENENQIIQLLREYAENNNLKFCIFNGTSENGKRMSVTDQMKLFRSAKVVVGPHGSGLANLIWLNPELNPKICEFTSGTQKIIHGGNFDKLYYLHFAKVFDDFADYYAIPFTEDSTPQITKVDIENVKTFIECISVETK